MTKVCSKCREEKPATTEYFEKRKGAKDGLRGQCKNCRKEYRKQRYQENKEEIKEYQKQYRKENKEYFTQWRKENKEYYKQYSKENKEKMKEYNKQWHKENEEEVKERKKQYYKENKEKLKKYSMQYSKQYFKENIDRFRQYDQKRRALKKRLPHTLTLDQWEKIKNDFNNECAYCGKTGQEHKEEFNEQLHQEHFIPLSKGGGYTHNNIIPACRSCNTSKHNTDFFEWYPTYEYYNEEREQFILEYLGYTEGTQQLTLEVEVI